MVSYVLKNNKHLDWLSKYDYVKTSIEYLVHKITSNGIRVDLKVTVAAKHMKARKSVFQLQSFLSSSNCYMRCLNYFSRLQYQVLISRKGQSNISGLRKSRMSPTTLKKHCAME